MTSTANLARGASGLLLVVGLTLACVPGESGEMPRPFFLRLYCGLRDFVAPLDFRVHPPEVDPCAVEPPSLEDLLPRERDPDGESR